MQRIDHVTAIAVLPDTSDPGAPGFFIDCGLNPDGSPIIGTIPDKDWFNGIQEEVCKVVEAAGITLDKANRTQLYNAILSIVNTAVPAASETKKGKAEIATQSETNAGTDNVRIVTPKKLSAYIGTLNFATQAWVAAQDFLKASVTAVVTAGFWTTPVSPVVAANGDVVLDPTKGNVFEITATKPIKFKNMANMPVGGDLRIHLTMNAAGGHGVLWEDQYLPKSGKIDTSPNAINVIYLGVVSGKFDVDITQRAAS